MINVTRTFLPPQREYQRYLARIWDSYHVTNHGPLVSELEQKLAARFNVKHLFFVSNGTIALQVAIRALNWSGRVLTTPFSYVATTSSLVWEGVKPEFIDIEAGGLNLDPNKFPVKPDSATVGILATHVYGNPCDVEGMKAYAQRHGLTVIYDAAHAFDVIYRDKNIAQYGDIVTMSFHATKLFHTGEGGAIMTNNDQLAHQIAYLRNFGHNGAEDFWGIGINGKNSELHAAMGLAVLPYVEKLIQDRKSISDAYDQLLDFTHITKPRIRQGTKYNFAYYPIIFQRAGDLGKVKHCLEQEDIYPRRYFYPSLNRLPYVSPKSCPISESISNNVLCLPFYPGLSKDAITKISELVNNSVLS